MLQSQNLNKNKNSEITRYCCSNPNCHKVFSRPKIIKYYVCPSCQTIIDLNSAKVKVHPILREKRVLVKETPKLRKKKVIKQAEKDETNTIEPTLIQPEKNAELTIAEKPLANEQLETEPPKAKSPELMELTLIQRLEAMVTETAKEKETPNSSSDAECSHYLGYLNQRVKGETIPETCIVCPKSIECLLSESDSSKEGLKEIKKWYSFKR